jgi:hypothetical protein
VLSNKNIISIIRLNFFVLDVCSEGVIEDEVLKEYKSPDNMFECVKDFV